MNLVITPSKFNMIRDAKPLDEAFRNQNISILVVDNLIREQFMDDTQGVWRRDLKVEYADNGFLVVFGLDKSGQAFMGSFREDYWPHAHSCPQCGTLITCECPFGELEFEDCVALCSKCKNKD